MNLYEIDKAIMNCIDDETGEVVGELFEQLQMEKDEKIENICLWVKNLNADAASLKAEKEAFAERQKAAENKAASLKKYLGDFLAGSKFETSKVKVSFRKSEVLEVSEDANIPEEYLKYSEPTINKADLKKAVKGGLELDGVHLIENQNIQIK